MCNSHSLRVIYVLCSCIDIFNLVGFVLSLCMLHVVWLSGYKTSNFSRSLHEVEVSTFMYSRVDFVLLCERGFSQRYSAFSDTSSHLLMGNLIINKENLLTHLHSERPKEARQFWKYFTYKSILMKTFEGEMLIRSQTKTLLQIYCELSLYSQVIFKSMRVADDTF